MTQKERQKIRTKLLRAIRKRFPKANMDSHSHVWQNGFCFIVYDKIVPLANLINLASDLTLDPRSFEIHADGEAYRYDCCGGNCDVEIEISVIANLPCSIQEFVS